MATEEINTKAKKELATFPGIISYHVFYKN